MDGEQEKETIDIDGMAFDVLVDRAEEVIAKCPMLFQKSGELVNIVRHRNGIGFHSIQSSYIRYILSQGAIWKDADTFIHPPPSIARCLLDKDDHKGIRYLRTVVSFPTMDGAGNISCEEGYNPDTEVYFAGGVRISVKDKPTLADSKEAIAKLLDVVIDFPFAGDEHRASWIAALLSPLSRFMHDGNIPLIVLQANAARTGKTRLAKIISLIVSGADIPFITHSESSEEERKKMFSFLKMGRCVALVDNVVGMFGSAIVNAIITSRFFEDRNLGGNRISSVVNDTSWMVSGNNIQLAPDTAERCLNIRLNCNEEHPALRSNWKHPELFEHVLKNREELLSCALTILRAYVVAGSPKQNIPAWGSFESWSNLVRGALVWAGMKDPAETRNELERDADASRFICNGLVEGWLELQAETGKFDGMTCREARDALSNDSIAAKELREALMEITHSRVLPSAHTIGRNLREVRDRVLGGKVLRCIPDDKNGHKWFVKPAKEEAVSV
jgi:hypothetical protein